MSKNSLSLAMAVRKHARKMKDGGEVVKPESSSMIDKIKSAFGSDEVRANYDAPGKPIRDPDAKKAKDMMSGIGYAEGGVVEPIDDDMGDMDNWLSSEEGAENAIDWEGPSDEQELDESGFTSDDTDNSDTVSLKSIMDGVRKRNMGKKA